MIFAKGVRTIVSLHIFLDTYICWFISLVINFANDELMNCVVR